MATYTIQCDGETWATAEHDTYADAARWYDREMRTGGSARPRRINGRPEVA